MKLHESMIVEQYDTLLDGLGNEAVGFYLAVERKLGLIEAPGVTWDMETGDTGLLRAMLGRRTDLLRIRHARFSEYSVLVSARQNGTVLHLSWLVLATAKFANDLRRTLRLDGEDGGRFQVGAELDVLDVLRLNDFFAVTKLAFKAAIHEFAHTEPADDSTPSDPFEPTRAE
jgi:hypothetical protein